MKQATGNSRTTTLAGMTLDQLRERYARELFEVFVPFWEEHGFDAEHGGFMCGLDYDGRLVHTDKFVWFQGRGIWIFSYLYNNFRKDPRYLEIARRTKDFMLKHARRDDGRWAELLSRDGRVLEGPSDMPFGGQFMAEGLHEYAQAAGDEQAHELALQIMKSLHGQSNASPGTLRPQGRYMLNAHITNQMLGRARDPLMIEMNEIGVDAIVNRYYNPEIGLNNELLDDDWGRPKEQATICNLGHSVEALWMVLDAAVHRKDQAVWDLCAERLRRHIEVGWDDVHGGLSLMVNVDQPDYEWPVERPVGTSLEFRCSGEYKHIKTSWALDEILIATLKVLERGPAEWAQRAFGLAQASLDDQHSMKKHGHPAGFMLFTDRQHTLQPTATRQDNYHHLRSVMLCLQSLYRLNAL
jgi:N-acylglucosamine 2-epimerase